MIREATPKDMPGIPMSLVANKLESRTSATPSGGSRRFTESASGTVGITAHGDCVELTGLTVDPLFRGKGLGHAMVEYACDQWLPSGKAEEILEN